jgi:hypothetical protein
MKHFSELSDEAQELIVDIVMGVYEDQPVPPRSPELQAELEEWANTEPCPGFDLAQENGFPHHQ